MTPFGTLVALAGAEAFLGLLFATLFFRLSRIYRRADLRFWTRAWISLLLHLAAVVVDDLLGRAGFGPGNPLRALSVAAYVATSTVAMVWLGLGAATFVSSLNPSRGMVRQVVGAAIAFGAMVGAAIWFLPIPADRVEFVREGLRAGVAAVIAAAVAAYTWHHGQRGSEGALLTKLGLTGLAVSQLHYAVVATLYRGEQGLTWPIAYFAVGDVLVWVLLGLGAIFWLLEQERAKVAEGALVRAELESDLRRRDLRFEAIVNGVQDLIIVLDATGKVTFSGHRESPVTRFTAEEVVGTSLEWHVHPEDLGQVRRAFGAALARPRETVSMLCRVRTRAGGWVTLECVAQNRLDEPGIQGILVTARDVTERLRLEAELEHAKRMESIGRLAGGVAHDFNNLLTVITGNASLGRDRLEPGAPGYRELTEVETAAAKAAALTRQLLSFARRQVVEPRTVDLNELLTTRLEGVIRRLLPDPVALAIAPSAAPAWVRADPGQLEQVVVNLAANARDVMTEGGRLTVAVGTVETSDTESPVADMAPGRYVTLAVRDTGPGIPEHVRPHLFEPFFTTKGTGRGTGLGLASSYGTVRQSGGHIGVESTPGQGATFTVYLPEAAPPTGTPPDGTPRRVHGGELVLVVEDEMAVRRVAVGALRDRGFEVLEAEDGRAGLDTFDRYADRVRCVVTDVVMPSVGGIALARELRQRQPGLPVLLTSGYAEQAPPVEDLGPGTDFIQKPYHPGDLAARVRSLIDRRSAAALPD